MYTIIKNNKFNLTNEDIEEIISDTFFVLWKNYLKLNENDKLNNYLAVVCKNILYNKLRKEKNISRNVNIEDYQNVLKNNINIQNISEEKDKIKIIEETLENIDEISRNVFVLFYYEQRKIKEISTILGITEANVKIKLHRTRKKIKKDLLKGGYRYE